MAAGGCGMRVYDVVDGGIRLDVVHSIAPCQSQFLRFSIRAADDPSSDGIAQMQWTA